MVIEYTYPMTSHVADSNKVFGEAKTELVTNYTIDNSFRYFYEYTFKELVI